MPKYFFDNMALLFAKRFASAYAKTIHEYLLDFISRLGLEFKNLKALT